MKYSIKLSNVDELLECIGEMQMLHNKKCSDNLDEIIDETVNAELSEDELESAAAAQGQIPLPDYIKNQKK